MSFNIYLPDLLPLLTEDRLKTLPLADVAWKGKHLPDKFTGENCICCEGKRFRAADTSIPGIVVERMDNPYNNKYRLIDGKHRVTKLAQSVQEYQFYVLSLSDIHGIITWTPTQASLKKK